MRGSDCNLCHDRLCDTCINFDSGVEICETCIANADNTTHAEPCSCNETFFWDDESITCFSCNSDCVLCRDTTLLTCTQCASPFFL